MRFYCFSEKRSFFQIFQDFPGIKLPLEYLFEAIPRIQPRSFSISSAQQAKPGEAHVTLAVVQYTTRMGRIRKGLCSNFLASLNSQGSLTCVDQVDFIEKPLVPIQITPGFTRLPNDPNIPVIMVGPGTGCAIFRSFLQQRQVLKSKGTSVGPAAFFFGCRHQEKDYLHKEDWEELVSQGILQVFDPAFSRDQKQKIYVQHKIKQHSKVLWEYIQKGAFIYVSG